MKKVILLFLVSFISLQSQWNQVGNAEKLSSDKTRIVNFAISEDSKNIYTLDSNSTIRKWDYSTGGSVWSRKIIPDSAKYHTSDWIYLSSDAKTYCNIIYLMDGNSQIYIDIYDIESGNKSDSVIISPGTNRGTYCGYIPLSNYADFISKEKRLIFGFNYKYICSGPWTSENYSGITFTSSKVDSLWITQKRILGTCEFIRENNDNSRKYFFITNNSYYFIGHNNPSSSSSSLVSNLYYQLFKDTIITMTYWQESSSWSQNSGSSHTIIGKSYPSASAFFDNNNWNIYFSCYNRIYKFNFPVNDIVKIDSLSRYPADKQIKIYNTTSNDYFIVTKANQLNIHAMYDYHYLNSYTIDNIDSVNIFKNSRDREFIFITDYKGDLYRLPYKNLYSATGIDLENISISQDEIVLSPNPASDFIEISVRANGLLPLQSDVRIYDIFGQTVSTPVCSADTPASGEKVRIDVSSLAPGMYFVRIGDRVSKFVKL